MDPDQQPTSNTRIFTARLPAEESAALEAYGEAEYERMKQRQQQQREVDDGQ